MDRVAPHFSAAEADSILDTFDLEDTLVLATDYLTIQYHARRKLREALDASLSALGFKPTFLSLLENINGVLCSGFVSEFLGATNSGRSEWLKELDRLEVCVPAGAVDEFVLGLLDSVSGVISEIHKWTRGDAVTQDMDLRRGLLDNSAISSVTRFTLASTLGDSREVDVVESSFNSPLAPILNWSRAEGKRALNGAGFYDFHYEWRLRDGCGETGRGAPVVEHARNEIIAEPCEPHGSSNNKPSIHTCSESTSCPLTLRSTTDSGVRFSPFTEKSALARLERCPTLLAEPPMRWRHGGRCSFDELGRDLSFNMYEEEWTESGSPIL